VVLGAAMLVVAGCSGQERYEPTREALAESVVDLSRQGYVVPLRVREQAAGRTSLTISTEVLFAFGSAEFRKPELTTVPLLAEQIPVGAAVLVVGHSARVDVDGEALSQRRADAVAAVLREAAPGLRVSAEGRGEREPVVRAPRSTRAGPPTGIGSRRIVISYGN